MSAGSIRWSIPLPDDNTLWVDANHGIRTNAEIERHLPNRSTLDKINDVASMLYNEIHRVYRTSAKRQLAQTHAVRFPQFTDDDPLGKTHQKGLILFFHGINGTPVAWDDHLTLVRQNPDLDFMAPDMPKAGHCTTKDEACRKLLTRIVDWTRQNPGMPVAIFGESNGSRFAVKFETWLRKHAPATPVHVSLLAGVLYGSTRINQALAITSPDGLETITGGKFSPIACEELAYGNPHAKKLLTKARAPLADGVAPREYIMYATLNDSHVPDHGSSLPILNPARQASFTEKHYIVTDVGHCSITGTGFQTQIQESLDWMRAHRPMA